MTAAGTQVMQGTIALRKAAAAAAYKNTPIIVAGGQGALGVRIVKELLVAGFKVTAAVADVEQAKLVADFAKRYELIDRAAASNLKLVEVDPEDPASLKALPKKSKIVVVEGDVEGKTKIGPKEVEGVLALLEATQGSQLVLVSTQAAAPSGGGGFSFFAPKPSAAKPQPQLSKTEQLVASSGKPYAIVRAFGTDRTEDDYPLAETIQVGNLGTLPTSQVASKAQVVMSVVALLKSPGVVNEVAIEVGGSAEPQLFVVDAINEILASLEAAQEAAAAEQAAKDAADRAALAGFFGFGAKKKEPAAEEEEPVETPALGTRSARRAAEARRALPPQKAEEEEEAVKPSGGFFGFGTGKVKAGAAKEAAKEEEAEEEEPKKGTGFFGFGTGKVKAGAAKEEAKEEAPRGRPGTRSATMSGTGKVKAAAPPAPAPSRGGTGRVRAGTESSRSGTAASGTGKSAPSRRKGDDFVYVE